MTPEVKLIYSSMLTREEYGNKAVPSYASGIVEKYIDILDIELTEFENIQLILSKVIDDRAC